MILIQIVLIVLAGIAGLYGAGFLMQTIDRLVK